MRNGKAGALEMHMLALEDKKHGAGKLPTPTVQWNMALTIGGMFYFLQHLLMHLLIIMSQVVPIPIREQHLHSMTILGLKEVILSIVMNAPEAKSHTQLPSALLVLSSHGANMKCTNNDIIMASPTAILMVR